MSKQMQEQQAVAGELSQDQLAQAAGGMINVRAVVASTVKGGALNPARSGGDDDLDDLEVER
jgi:hypothetical protein